MLVCVCVSLLDWCRGKIVGNVVLSWFGKICWYNKWDVLSLCRNVRTTWKSGIRVIQMNYSLLILCHIESHKKYETRNFVRFSGANIMWNDSAYRLWRINWPLNRLQFDDGETSSTGSKNFPKTIVCASLAITLYTWAYT